MLTGSGPWRSNQSRQGITTIINYPSISALTGHGSIESRSDVVVERAGFGAAVPDVFRGLAVRRSSHSIHTPV